PPRPPPPRLARRHGRCGTTAPRPTPRAGPRPPTARRAARCRCWRRRGSSLELCQHAVVAGLPLGGGPQRAVLAPGTRLGLVPEAARRPLPRPDRAEGHDATRRLQLGASDGQEGAEAVPDLGAP